MARAGKHKVEAARGTAAGVALAATAVVLVSGCEITATFHCEESPQCGTGGRCEPDSLCSYPDTTCPSGWRYGEHSGGLANECAGGSGTVTVGFQSAMSLEDETSGSIEIPVTLSAPSSTTVTVAFMVTGMEANAGDDFAATDGLLIFDPGIVQQAVPVTIVADGIEEPDERFQVALSGPTGDTELGQATHAVTISADILPRVQLAAGATMTLEADTATFSVQLDIPSTTDITVSLAISGSAALGVDYTAATAVTIPAGELGAPLPVAILDDLLDEDSEGVVIDLAGATGAVIGVVANQVHTIEDDDPIPTVTFQDATSQIAEDGGGGNVTVSLSGPSGRMVTVNFVAPVNGSTAAASDYSITTAQALVFTPGTTSLPIAYTITNDNVDEPNEMLLVDLANPTNVMIGMPNRHTLTLLDNDTASVSFDPTESDTSGNEGNFGTSNFNFDVVLSIPSATMVTVNVVFSGNATTPGDYSVASGDVPVVFPPGDTQERIQIIVVGDFVDEPGASEVITMTLANASGAQIVSPSVRSHTIQDDD